MKSSPEIESIVRRFVAARKEGDREVFAGHWSRSKHLVVIGSDEHEWWLNPDDLIPVSSAHLEESPVEEVEILRLYAFEEGNFGWAALELLYAFEEGNVGGAAMGQRRTNPEGGSGVFRQTLIFELEAGFWKIVHSHFSAPVPNLETFGVESTRTLSELVDSVDAELDLASAGVSTGTTTLMFTDIVDSTPLSVSLGETTWLRVIKSHFEKLRNIVEGRGGSVVKTLGDGGMYAFASGSSALKAAIEIQREMDDSVDPELRIRIGVHTGDVMEAGGDYVGSTVAKAARVAAAADGGQILASSTTVGLVNPSEFEFGTPITVELKGIQGTHQLQPVKWYQ